MRGAISKRGEKAKDKGSARSGARFVAWLEPCISLFYELRPSRHEPAKGPQVMKCCPLCASKILAAAIVAELVVMTSGLTQTNVPPTAAPAAPPAAPAKRSAADLEKLVAPIALYADPLIATVLPASAYPLEIVEASRFVKDTNNIAKLDAQPWDENVKAVARIPEVIAQLNENLTWTTDLGAAFVAQPKE